MAARLVSLNQRRLLNLHSREFHDYEFGDITGGDKGSVNTMSGNTGSPIPGTYYLIFPPNVPNAHLISNYGACSEHSCSDNTIQIIDDGRHPARDSPALLWYTPLPVAHHPACHQSCGSCQEVDLPSALPQPYSTAPGFDSPA